MKNKKHHKLQLENQGNLSIFFTGTGAAFVKTLFQNNIMIVKGKEHLLVDCGTRCFESLNSVGVEVRDVKNVLITHTHADHIGGLEELMLLSRYLIKTKPRMVINEEFENILWNQSLRGGAAHSEVHDGKPLDFGDFWERLRPKHLKDMPRETWGLKLSNLDIKMPRTMHTPDSALSWKDSFWSCAVIIDNRILFTSDTQYDPDLILSYDALYDFEIIFHDCQMYSGGVHASLEELCDLPDHIKSKILLMHYDDKWNDSVKKIRDAGFLGFAKQFHSYDFD